MDKVKIRKSKRKICVTAPYFDNLSFQIVHRVRIDQKGYGSITFLYRRVMHEGKPKFGFYDRKLRNDDVHKLLWEMRGKKTVLDFSQITDTLRGILSDPRKSITFMEGIKTCFTLPGGETIRFRSDGDRSFYFESSGEKPNSGIFIIYDPANGVCLRKNFSMHT
jgi:hypothetical protein